MLIIRFEGTGSFHEKKYLRPINLDQLSTNGRVLQLHINLYIYIYVRASSAPNIQLLSSFSFFSYRRSTNTFLRVLRRQRVTVRITPKRKMLCDEP